MGTQQNSYRDAIKTITIHANPDLYDTLKQVASEVGIPIMEAGRRAIEAWCKEPTFENSVFKANLNLQRGITGGRGPNIPLPVRYHAALSIVADAEVFGLNLSRHKVAVAMATGRNPNNKSGGKELAIVQKLIDQGFLEYGQLFNTMDIARGVKNEHRGKTCLHVTESGKVELARLEEELLK
jgi:hypothetical protein